jgi:hypothetical protein
MLPVSIDKLAPQVVPINRENLQSRRIGINSRVVGQQMCTDPLSRFHPFNLNVHAAQQNYESCALPTRRVSRDRFSA